MNDLYEFLITLYDYDKIVWKDNHMVVDMGFIGNNSYHVEISSDTIYIIDLNGRRVAEHNFKDTTELNTIISTFKDSASKQPKADDESIDDYSVDELVARVTLPPVSKQKIRIYTFGKAIFNKAHLKVDRFYDVSRYRSYIPSTFDSLRYLTGKDEIVQKFIALGVEFESTLLHMINDIEKNDHSVIGIFCAHGKHRSVSFAEILKYYVYRKSIVNHLCIK